MNEDNLKVKETEKSALLPHKSHCVNPCHFSAVLSHIWMVAVPHWMPHPGNASALPLLPEHCLKKELLQWHDENWSFPAICCIYVRLSQTIGQNLYYCYFPSHKYYTSPLYRICCPRTCDLHLLTSLHPIHQVKHCMLAGIDSKSSASGMQQLRVLHLSGTQKNPHLVHVFNVQHFQ